MNLTKNLLAVAATAVLATLALPAAAQTRDVVAPTVRVLSPIEASGVDGLAPVPLVDLNLKPSAHLSIRARNRPGSPKTLVMRSNVGVDAALYADLPATYNPPKLPAATVASYPFNVETSGDVAQGWATMTAQGVPHLYLSGLGDFRADATASWNSRFAHNAGGSREVVLRFMVPPTVVSGFNEVEGPARWRARMRTDVLLNGFPVWSTEALRLRADYVPPNNAGQPLVVLQQWGDPMDFPTDDEDTDATNDSNAGSVDQASQGKMVYLSLGRFNPGQQMELTMIVRGTAWTQPAIAGGDDHACVHDGRYFCTRATVAVKTGNTAPQITLMP